MTQNPLVLPEETAPADPVRVKALAESINLDDPALTITYGAETMTDIAKFSDSLLQRVQAKNAGPVGDILTDLLLKVRGIDLTSIGKKQGLMEKIPFLGSFFHSMNRSVARFNTLSGQVDDISSRLDQAMTGLLKDIEVLEQLYAHNEQFYHDLSLFLEAGRVRLEQAKNTDLPRLREEAERSGNTLDAQRVRDFAEKINRFERRLHDLRLSRTITVQTAPQIRLIQGNNQTLAEKIQTSILSTIPIWKSQMVLALSLHGQKGAARLHKEVSDTTNTLLRSNAEMLETATLETAREVERSVVDVETLRDAQQRLVSTIEETMRIAEEGRNKRLSVEKELRHMEGELRERLAGLGAEKTARTLAQAEGSASVREEGSATIMPALEEGETGPGASGAEGGAMEPDDSPASGKDKP